MLSLSKSLENEIPHRVGLYSHLTDENSSRERFYLGSLGGVFGWDFCFVARYV